MNPHSIFLTDLVQESLAPEEWRAVKGYEGIYEVSSWGRVRSLDREDSGGRPRKGKMLRTNNARYLGVNLSKNSQQTFIRVHRLVAETFLGECPKGYQVHHKDGDTHNNNVSNLEYVSPAKNMAYACEAGSMGKLSPEDVRYIYTAYTKNSVSLDELAQVYEVHRSTITSALSGKTHSHLFLGEDALIPIVFPGPTKISDFIAQHIKRQYERGGESCYTLARKYKVHPVTIYKIVNGFRKFSREKESS